MLRLITSRWVRLALASAAVAVIVVTVVRLRRRPVRQEPVISVVASEGEAGEAESAPEPRWPRVPVLGVPTDDDLGRYAGGPSAPKRFFGNLPPRVPLDEAVRSRLVRWGAVGIGLCLLFFGTQVLETMAFSNETETVEETTAFVGSASWGPISPEGGSCSASTDGFPEPSVHCLTETGSALVGSEGWNPSLDAPDGLYAVEMPDQVPADDEPVPVPEPIPDADCRPEVGAPRVRAVSPGVTRAVNRQWRRIETWLKANAPKSHSTLGKPGKAGTIAVAEAQMGLRFPDDLRASLLRHDGAVSSKDAWAFGFLGNWNQGVRGIRDTWRGLCEIDGEDEGGGEGESDSRAEWWDGRMIPFGADGSGNHLVIDSVVGDVGDTDHEGSMSFTPGAIRIGSYYELLKATANALETGGSIGYWKPEAVDGELEWNIPD